jgi:hypothetical protein
MVGNSNSYESITDSFGRSLEMKQAKKALCKVAEDSP